MGHGSRNSLLIFSTNSGVEGSKQQGSQTVPDLTIATVCMFRELSLLASANILALKFTINVYCMNEDIENRLLTTISAAEQ